MKANEVPENYPIQFKDKIDEYLWKEHQILGGCCSSIENLKYSIAREVAEKLTDAFIERAVECLNKELYTRFSGNEYFVASNKAINLQEFIKNFKNYMLCQ